MTMAARTLGLIAPILTAAASFTGSPFTGSGTSSSCDRGSRLLPLSEPGKRSRPLAVTDARSISRKWRFRSAPGHLIETAGRQPKSDQHRQPDQVEKVPVIRRKIDGEMTLVIVFPQASPDRDDP